MLKPICVKCERFYQPKRNGIFFEEGMPTKNGALPGKDEPDAWESYKLWCGDLWYCPNCDHELIVGVGHAPISEHYKPEYRQFVKERNATLMVKDC